MNLRRLLSHLCLASLAAILLPSIGSAQDRSTDPIHLIVGWPAGGASDTVARVIATAMSSALNRSIVINNYPGAGGNIGTEMAARAKPDGNTILLATGASHGINPALYRRIGYDPIKDFAPVGMICSSASVLIVADGSPLHSVKDLIATGRAQPGKLNYGSAGNGSSGHIAGAMLQQVAGFEATHVPYKGGAPAMTDLIGGRLDFMLDSGAIPLIKSGKLHALAVAAPKRLAALPNVPTFAEAGVAGFETNWWYGLVAPAGTPRAVLDQCMPRWRSRCSRPTFGNDSATWAARSTPAASTSSGPTCRRRCRRSPRWSRRRARSWSSASARGSPTLERRFGTWRSLRCSRASSRIRTKPRSAVGEAPSSQRAGHSSTTPSAFGTRTSRGQRTGRVRTRSQCGFRLPQSGCVEACTAPVSIVQSGPDRCIDASARSRDEERGSSARNR